MKKASATLNANSEGINAIELAIENDRLRTTIMMLNQKINAQEEYEEQIIMLKEKN